MSRNIEKIFLYFMYFMCFGVFVSISNMKFLNNINLKYSNINKIGLFILSGICLTIIYYIILGIIISWILNLIYIFCYKRYNYSFIEYNFFPIIYIKSNNKKIKFSFNFLLLNEIGSMIDIKDIINNEDNLNEYIENTKKVYSKLVYTHYILIFVGIIVAIFNFSLGGMIIVYNIALIIFQSVGKSDFFTDGYVYLSKNIDKYNVIYTIINLLKVQNFSKKFLYSFLQKNIVDKEIDNILTDEFYQTLIIDSIISNINYMNIKVRKKIDLKFNQQAHFNEYEFLKHYRLYRLYCIYILKFYGENEYEILVNEINKFYEKSQSMIIGKYIKIFNKDRMILNNHDFKSINLKNKLDICNSFDTYINKLYIVSNVNSKI